MGQANTIPRRINGVEGAAGQVQISGGPGVLESWGAPAPAAHVHAAGDVTSGQFPLARMPRAAAGNFLEGNGVAADPIFNALIAANIPNLAASKITSGRFPVDRLPAVTDEFFLVGTGTNMEERAVPGPLPGERVTVAGMQAITATGTVAVPTNINDGNTGTYAEFDVVNEYVEFDFTVPVVFTQYRQYGHDNHNEDGVWKAQYWDAGAQAWVDWIATFNTIKALWSDWITVSTIRTTKLKIICTTKDTGPAGQKSYFGEFEFKY